MSTSRSLPPRHGSRFLLLLMALLGIALAVAVPSAAHANAAVCAVGSHRASWSPGVTNAVEQHVVTTDTDWSCVQVQLGLPLSTTASSHAEFTAPFSCVNLFSTEPTTWTIDWADGRAPATSTFNFTATAVPVDGNLVITATGSITSGRFNGHRATSEFILANLAATLNGQCASPNGVTNASGLATLVVL
ncbi:MAG TPA: hypothetical protein VM621_14950 [Luteibacter sp.]|uniref:hypothetical protein n=1 Tax=Luteibacter sp. TaxID=1886636 RepID=UPI002B9D8F04|nr:hypothetical protein [Luteibacter sp.]HVI56338.1 hypothetical protein [Luteibacter sp.]